MPTNMFFELSEEKRAKIIDVSMGEFSEYGYEGSSTNRIVQNAGISKGSLFKYFKSKDELYFYILDLAVQEMTADLAREICALSKDLFERITHYAEIEFAWYMKHPEKCRLITAAFTRNGGAIYQKTEARYGERGREIYDGLLEDIDTSRFRLDKKEIADMIRWFLEGFNEDFIVRIEVPRDVNIDDMRRVYMKRLSGYMDILRDGLMAEEKGD